MFPLSPIKIVVVSNPLDGTLIISPVSSHNHGGTDFVYVPDGDGNWIRMDISDSAMDQSKFPYMKIPHQWGKLLYEELRNIFEPPKDSLSLDAASALKSHLEDMKKLVFEYNVTKSIKKEISK